MLKVDLYTKLVLTLIALFLAILAVRSVIPSASADDGIGLNLVEMNDYLSAIKGDTDALQAQSVASAGDVSKIEEGTCDNPKLCGVQ